MKRKSPLALLLLLLFGCLNALQAQYSYTPDEIDYGTWVAGESISGAIFFNWFTSGGVTVSAAANNPAFVSVSPPQFAYSDLGATFVIEFSPQTAGNFSGVITLSGDLGNGIETLAQVPVRGIGVAPFSVTPGSISFDTTFVGASKTKQAAVNMYEFESSLVIGTPVSQSEILTVRSSNPEVFEVSPTTFSPQFGEPTILTVTFRPNTAGTLRETITISNGSWTERIGVEGDGLAFQIAEPRVDVGGALVGCSTAKPFTITTGSPFDFEIVPTRPDLPFTTEPATFTASQATPVLARFTPVAAGQAQGVFRIIAKLNGRTVQQQELPFLGAGVTPIASPASLDFGNVPTGTNSSPRSANIATNPATEFQGAYSATSDNPAFRVASVSTSGKVEVVFAPRSEGPANGVIAVQVASASDSQCTAPVEIPVTGVGAATEITVTPSSIDFGTISVGQISPSREVLISNESSVEYTGTITIDNAVFTLGEIPAGGSAQSALTVPAGGAVRVPVRFRPTTAGAVAGIATLSLEGTPSGASQPITVTRRVNLRGEGAAAILSYRVIREGSPGGLTPGGAVSFTPTLVGAANSVNFEVRNDGSNSVEVTEIAVTGGPFSATLPDLPAVIAPGSALSFALTFQPSELNAFSGTLQVGGATFSLEGNSILSGAEITGITDTLPLNQQPTVGLKLSSAAPQDLAGALGLTYTPQGDLPADPSVQFETGGTSVDFTIPAGSDTAVFPDGQPTVGFQTGTVAGSFAFTASLQRGETDVTPSPAPTRSATVAGGPPVISRVLVESVTATGFTVVVIGYSPNREITQATFNLTGRNGIQVQPATVTPNGISDVFRNWFQSEASHEFGSMFTLTVPFTISGETNAIASISATVSNSTGASQAVSANLP